MESQSDHRIRQHINLTHGYSLSSLRISQTPLRSCLVCLNTNRCISLQTGIPIQAFRNAVLASNVVPLTDVEKSSCDGVIMSIYTRKQCHTQQATSDPQVEATPPKTRLSGISSYANDPSPESRMRRLVLQAEYSRLSCAPQTISPLSPLRNPNPGLDPPFWNSNPTLYHATTKYLNRSDRYRENFRPRRGRNCEERHQYLALDEECLYCQISQRDTLRKRLLARRSQASNPPGGGGVQIE